MRARPLGTAVLSIALLVTAAPAATAGESTRPASPDERQRSPAQVVRQGLRDVVEAGAVGVTAHVVDHGTVTRATHGYAQLDPDRRATGDPRFRAASMTKQVVAVLSLQLVENGRWRLGTTVGDVLPGTWPAAGDVTVGQLLSHTSGLPDYLPALVQDATTPKAFLAAVSERRTERSLIEIARGLEPTGEPGEGYTYSNTNYVLLGLMLRRTTGTRLPGLVESRVLRPARMTRSRYALDRRLASPRLKEYAALGRGGSQLDLSSFSPTMFAGAGALVTTARDLNRFQRALSQHELIGPTALRRMRSVITPADEAGVAYGYGSYRVPDPCRPGKVLHGHDGASWATHTLSFSSPDGSRRVTVAMTGRQYTTKQPAYAALNRLVVDAFATTCGGTPAARTTTPVLPAPVDRSMMVPWT